MAYCRECGAWMKDDCVFCTECGKPISQNNICPYCASSINPGDYYCQNCGKRIDIATKYTVYSTKSHKADRTSSVWLIVLLIGFGFFMFLFVVFGGFWYYHKYYKKTPFNVATTDSIEEVMAPNNQSDFYIEYQHDNDEVDELLDDSDLAYNELDEKNESFNEEDTNIYTNKIYDVVEEMPQFPGGPSALFEYLSTNIKYPVVAEENGVQGRVIATFIVERDGSITDVKVVKSVDPSLDKEAQRVVKSMPHWIPGKQNGSAVRVKYTVPVTFRLQ